MLDRRFRLTQAQLSSLCTSWCYICKCVCPRFILKTIKAKWLRSMKSGRWATEPLFVCYYVQLVQRVCRTVAISRSITPTARGGSCLQWRSSHQIPNRWGELWRGESEPRTEICILINSIRINIVKQITVQIKSYICTIGMCTSQPRFLRQLLKWSSV